MKVKAIDENLYLKDRKKQIKDLIDNEQLDKRLQKTIVDLIIPSVSLTTKTEHTLLEYTITEDGIYLITGYSLLNHYGQTGRELNLFLKKNGEDFFVSVNVYNGEWTVSVPISAMQNFKKGDVLTIFVTNYGAKNWMHGLGKLQLLKL